MSDSRTLAWAQAFEAYHRIRFNQSGATTRARERYERVLASCQKDDREWLRVRLEHADEPSLRVRVKEVCRRVASIVDPLLSQHPLRGPTPQPRHAWAYRGHGALRQPVRQCCEGDPACR